MTHATNTALALLREIYDDARQGALPNPDSPWWAAAKAALAAPAQPAALIKARKCDYCSREVVASVTTCICGSTEFGIQAALTHAGEYPPLDKGSLWRDKTSIRGYGADPGPGPWYTTEDVHRAIDDACAARETAKAAGVHPSIIETLQALAGEVDAGWTDAAKTALRKLQTLTAMHGATQAAPLTCHPAVKPNVLVNGGALKLALNVLRRAGKGEVADELEITAQAAPVDADMQTLIDSAPEPFRRLGEFLAGTLDEDQWATAQSLLLGGLVAVQEGRDLHGEIDHYNENMG